MKIAIYFPRGNPEHTEMLGCFYEGLRFDALMTVYAHDVTEYKPEHTDIAVVFGIEKEKVPISHARGKIIRRQAERGLPTIILEKGYIERDEYYAVGIGGLNGRANFGNANSPDHRVQRLTNTKMKPWRESGEHVLVIGQVPTDASVENVNFFQWVDQTIKEIRKHTDRQIIFRPHPLAVNRTPAFDGTVHSLKPLADDLEKAHAVVTYNSNTGVDAVLSGVPVFAADQGSMVYDIANRDLTDIEKPKTFDRDQWLNNISYAQWNPYEMRGGLAWQHIKKEILRQIEGGGYKLELKEMR